LFFISCGDNDVKHLPTELTSMTIDDNGIKTDDSSFKYVYWPYKCNKLVDSFGKLTSIRI
jgi:hypothetical protein